MPRCLQRSPPTKALMSLSKERRCGRAALRHDGQNRYLPSAGKPSSPVVNQTQPGLTAPFVATWVTRKTSLGTWKAQTGCTGTEHLRGVPERLCERRLRLGDVAGRFMRESFQGFEFSLSCPGHQRSSSCPWLCSGVRLARPVLPHGPGSLWTVCGTGQGPHLRSQPPSCRSRDKSKWVFKTLLSAQACVSRLLSLTPGEQMRQVSEAQTGLQKRTSGYISLRGHKGKEKGGKRKSHSSVLLPLLSQTAVRHPRDLAVSHRRHQW